MGGSTKLPSNTMLFFTYQKLRRQINMCMHISLRPGYVQIYETSVRFFNVCHPIELKCDFSIINEFNSNRIKLHYSQEIMHKDVKITGKNGFVLLDIC